jgi:1,2-diacylglycerol 3-alpha-glucosyltransferase
VVVRLPAVIEFENSRLRVALACSGIGHVSRGYEGSVLQLFEAISGKVDARLYVGKPATAGTVCRTTINRLSALYKLWPLSGISQYSRYRNENYSFAMQLIPALIVSPVDVIFTPDHCLALLLQRIRRLLPGKPAVIFSNGAPFENSFCERFAAVHQKSFSHYTESEGSELHGRSFLIPNGFDPARLTMPESFRRENVLQRYGIDNARKIILSLSALNKTHKRVDWLLTEFAQLDQSRFSLIVAGQPGEETDELKSLSSSLGCHAKFLTVPHHEVPELIWAADMMALTSLSEGFPRSVAEAMGAKRHIFVHPHENARWIVGDNTSCFVDMRVAGALKSAIEQALAEPKVLQTSVARNFERFNSMFSWQCVANAYLRMFHEVAMRDRASSVGSKSRVLA